MGLFKKKKQDQERRKMQLLYCEELHYQLCELYNKYKDDEDCRIYIALNLVNQLQSNIGYGKRFDLDAFYKGDVHYLFGENEIN